MVETMLAGDHSASISRHERTQVIVHFNAEMTEAHLHDGPCIGADTARRLSCDAPVCAVFQKALEVLDLGRTQRLPNRAQRRALMARDGGCRFPGCPERRYVEAHHVRHWIDGGPTDLANLVLLCWRHHHAVHEGGYSMALAAGALTVWRPDGTVLQSEALFTGDPAAIVEENKDLGLAITPTSVVSQWDGRPVNYADAVEGLLWLEDRYRREVFRFFFGGLVCGGGRFVFVVVVLGLGRWGWVPFVEVMEKVEGGGVWPVGWGGPDSCGWTKPWRAPSPSRDVGAAAVGETVPVEVRGCQSYVDHGVDLCAQLAFDVGQLGLCEERGALGRRVDVELVGVGVEQRGHVGLGGGGPQRYSGESRMSARWMPNGMCGRSRSSRIAFAAAGHGTIRLQELAMPFSIDSTTAALTASCMPKSSQLTISTRASGGR